MVDQTHQLSAYNGRQHSASSHGFAGSVRELLRDAITLGELQVQLLLLDLREGSTRMVRPLLVIVFAICLALGCFPVALAALAYALQATGMPVWGAFLTSALIGLFLSAGAAYGGLRWLKKELSIIDRSKAEFQSNINWLKTALKTR